MSKSFKRSVTVAFGIAFLVAVAIFAIARPNTIPQLATAPSATVQIAQVPPCPNNKC